MKSSPLDHPVLKMRRMRSHPKISNGNTVGFSLIEMMVVVALIGLITTLALPGISSFLKVSIQSATRELATTIKQSYNTTMMTGQIHRLVIDLDEQTYWVESGPNDFLLSSETSRRRDEERKRFARFGTASTDGPQKPPAFKINPAVTSKKLQLPRGVIFEDVYTEQSKEPLTQGQATAHFFPHGITERTIIHLKDKEERQISLIVSALLGQTKLVEHYVKPDEEITP